jgi:choline-sulfatase
MATSTALPLPGRPPNILLIMSDEHGPMFSGCYGHPLIETPALDALARRGVLFEHAYCNVPLCVPSRMSFMTGRYVHHIGTWDNSSPLPSDAVTWAHCLAAAGYEVVLDGKMHFIGPDQLHGFARQIGVDLHAQQHHALANWDAWPRKAAQPWPGVRRAGPGTTREIEVDDLVAERALEFLRDPARRARPWALCVGFIAPHFPFVVPEPYFSRYYPERADLPDLPPGHLERLPPAARRLQEALGTTGYSEDEIRRARAAYYGLITYLDDKIRCLLACLEEQGLAEQTVVIYTSDHGELAGEHGLWRKMSFYEQSARVPLIVSWPGVFPAGVRRREVVSLVDLTATLLDLAAAWPPEVVQGVPALDGESLLPLLTAGPAEPVPWKDEAFCELEAHGTDRPLAMLRRGRWKLCYAPGAHPSEPPELELYDLEGDPGEFENLAGKPELAHVQRDLLARLLQEWDPWQVWAAVLQSQRSRRIIERARIGAMK